ncbi:MAG: S41 family peptidase [Pseudomonadota bacterium]
MPDSAQGVWISNGYGFQLVVGEDYLSAYHVTDAFCTVSRDTADELATLMDRFVLVDDGRLIVSSSLDSHSYYFERVDSLDPYCTNTAKTDAQTSFDAFADLMSTHYAFFELHGVDWDQRVATARQRMKPDMTEQQLFDLMASMLVGLEDAHLSLEAEIDGEPNSFKSDIGAVYAFARETAAVSGQSFDEVQQDLINQLWREQVGQTTLQGQGVLVANNRIQYGMADAQIGYIGIVSMGGFADEENLDPASELDVLKSSLDEAISHWRANDAKAVIVDVSFNHGGYDFVANAIAKRFTDSSYHSYTRSPADASRPYETQYMTEPSSDPQFLGPIYMFTSDMTVSAGEVFVLAMKPLPNVTHVGERTRGAFSTILTKSLPNGWTLNMSNEIYRDHNGVVWEGQGVSPDKEIEVFVGTAPALGLKNALSEVISIASASAN